MVDASLIFEETSISRHFTKSGIFFFYDVKNNGQLVSQLYIPSVHRTAQNILHNCRRCSFND